MTSATDPEGGGQKHTPRERAAESMVETADPQPDEFSQELAALAAAPPVSPYSRLSVSDGDLVAGHYRIVRKLGVGGMGVVYLAHDTKLDRKVALKYQLGGRSKHEIERLEREARAMAPLSHPNVLSVFEVGEHQGHLFIAMEFVDGGTLEDWLDAQPRPWRDVVRLFIGIAEGLHCAHEAGIVHRDLKPANVLLGSDGRPRIADFGLALSTHIPTEELPEQAEGSDIRLTATGVVVGTPAYMAPEQFTGLDATAAADQFSFFVALFEALYGGRPFKGKTIPELAERVSSGAPPVPPNGHQGPRALVDIIEHGLAVAPGSRYPSMEEVRAELSGVLNRGKRRAAWAFGGLAAVAASFGGYQSANAVAPRLCDDTDGAVAWTSTRRAEVQQALASAQVPDADRVVALLDEHATLASAARSEACQAAKVQGTTSDNVYSLQVACFDRYDSQVEGLALELEELSSSPEALLPTATEALRTVQNCSDTEGLARLSNAWSRTSALPNADDRARDAKVRLLLTRAQVRAMTGEIEAATGLADEAEQLLLGVEVTHERRVLHKTRAQLARYTGKLETAQRETDEALVAASADGDLDGMATVALLRADHSMDRGDHELARTNLAYHGALKTASGLSPRPAEDRQRRSIEAQLALHDGEPAKVRRLIDFLDDPDLSEYTRTAALDTLGGAAMMEDDYELAYEIRDESRRRYAQRNQKDARYASLLVNVATPAIELGRLDDAQELLAQAETIARESDGQVLLLAIALNNHGRVLRLQGRLDEAHAKHSEAVELSEAKLGSDHVQIAFALDGLGELERIRGNHELARKHLFRSLQIRDAKYRPGSIFVARTIMLLARVYTDEGNHERAKGASVAALAIQHAKAASDDGIAASTFELARAERALGNEIDAGKLVREAVARCDNPSPDCISLREAAKAFSAEAPATPKAPTLAAASKPKASE